MSNFEAEMRMLIKDAVIEAVQDMQKIAPSGSQLSEPVSEPGTRRTRRTKEQIAADEAAKAKVAQEVPPKGVTVDYAELQKAVIELIEKDQKTDVITILSQFGVATAKQLQPARYAECLAMLKEKLSSEGETELA
jgi:hypothetical protein